MKCLLFVHTQNDYEVHWNSNNTLNPFVVPYYMMIWCLYLIQEFSTEIILCLMEITQFQQIVHRYYRENYHRRAYGNRDILTKQYWLTASHTAAVPRSSIVFGAVNKRDSNISNITTTTTSTASSRQLSVIEMEMVQSTTQSSGLSGASGTSAASEDTQIDVADLGDLAIEYEPEMTKCEEFIQRAQSIHNKYICVGSEFEVNLSWTTRCVLADKLNKLLQCHDAGGVQMDEEDRVIEIYQLFIPTMDALHLLLRSTFLRFTSSALFEQLMSGQRGRK